MFIETCRLQSCLFSTVRHGKDYIRQFIIRHKDDISTRAANRKAFKVIVDGDNKVLRRRLEMFGFNSYYLV